ncbi:MAG TPA: alpha-glucuronidase family glycosyl hydrolase [Thermomicrobiales bacterium]|nr:alpha-glucuronidase family glycosyl hydrolase [Thermomicrobiales bacterium]
MRLNRRAFVQSGLAAGAVIAGMTQDAQVSTAPPVPSPHTPLLPNEDGYELWLRYRPVTEAPLLAQYRSATARIVQLASGPIAQSINDELDRACKGMLNQRPTSATSVTKSGTILMGTPDRSSVIQSAIDGSLLSTLGDEGYVLRTASVSGHATTIIAANHERGLLYGAFAFIKQMQLRNPVASLDIVDVPRANLRMVNHWDGIDRTVARGYAGLSIFNFADLTAPNPRYTDYARLLASVGINATVINNVNASPEFLDSSMMPGYASLAGIFRQWGITLYLSVNFASPIDLTVTDLTPITTADPLDQRVQEWWTKKIGEIYRAVPDFGGFLVKANSEGEPGPLTYNRTHAQGANMLARALKPHGGTVIWRSFVHAGFHGWSEYEYDTFHPLDGKFDRNALLQTKNGPIDFLVREPVNPLFGAMSRTNQMIELQITQEYTGHATHLCYLPTYWALVLGFQTHYAGTGPTVAEIIDGTANNQPLGGFAGVINFGDDRNWTGSFLAAANTHGFARLAWDHTRSVKEIATEWVTLTFGPDEKVVSTVVPMLLSSWQTYEMYTSPFGVGYLVSPNGAHFEPDPRGTENLSHVTDNRGSGYDRTLATGSGFTRLYSDYWFNRYEQLASCPEALMMFMHIVPWEHRLTNGTTTIQQMYDDYFTGVDDVLAMQSAWKTLAGRIDEERFSAIAQQFDRQLLQSRIWRDVMVSYYFDAARTISTAQPWVQLEMGEDSTLLLGGATNHLAMRLTNATGQPQVLHVAIDSSQVGWTSTSLEKKLSARESGEGQLSVTPPVEPYLGPVSFSCNPRALTTLGFDTQILIVTPAAKHCTYAFDVGSKPNSVVPGYHALTAADIWSTSSTFGWVGAPPIDFQIVSKRDVLQNDCATDGVPRTIRLQIPPGHQRAWVLIGGQGTGTQPVRVSLGHETLVETSYLEESEFQWFGFTLNGGAHGKIVDLTVAGADGRYWRLAGLVVLKPGQ